MVTGQTPGKSDVSSRINKKTKHTFCLKLKLCNYICVETSQAVLENKEREKIVEFSLNADAFCIIYRFLD